MGKDRGDRVRDVLGRAWLGSGEKLQRRQVRCAMQERDGDRAVPERLIRSDGWSEQQGRVFRHR